MERKKMNKIVVNEKKYVLDALNGTEKPDIGFYSFLNIMRLNVIQQKKQFTM